MYELFVFPGLCVLVNSAVGGGSATYGGLLEPPRNPALWQGRHPELDAARIERYYDKVIADMGGVRLGQDHAVPQSVWTHLPAGTGRRCLPAQQQPHMALLIPPSQADAGRAVTMASGVQREYCGFGGDSFLGSRGGAKASVDFVYLAPVLGKGVTVRDLCQVTRIQAGRPVDGEGYIVRFIDQATRQASFVRGKTVILAAGTMNTLRLLFAGAADPGGLAPMPALGRNFSANGDLVGIWLRNHAPVSSFRSTPSQGAFGVAGYECSTYGLGGFPGLQTMPLPSFVKRRLEKAYFIYGMGADSSGSSVGFDRGELRCNYDERREPIYTEVRGRVFPRPVRRDRRRDPGAGKARHGARVRGCRGGSAAGHGGRRSPGGSIRQPRGSMLLMERHCRLLWAGHQASQSPRGRITLLTESLRPSDSWGRCP